MTEEKEPQDRSGAAVVLGLAVLASVLAIVVQAEVFPHGSINNDEAIYRLQAQAIRHGHFFLPLVPPAGAFRPWLAALVAQRWVLKYLPVEGALLAAAGAIAGTPSAALPVVAAAAALSTWLLFREVLEDSMSAMVATALVVVSPLVVVQSSLLVGYLPTLALLELFAWTLIRATRCPSARWGVVGGVAVGLAGIARPYDTVLFAVPLVVWAAVRLGRRIGPPLVWYLLGALPPVAGMLLYDWAATGNALRLPFNLLEPADRPGFGPRRMFPQEPYHAFGLRQGISGSSSHLLLTTLWVAGGPVLVLLAVVGLWRRRRSGLALALAAAGVAFPLGYVFFWGAWNASKLWHGVKFIGPFYFLPLVVPIAAFGGAELVALYRRYRSLAWATVAIGVVASVLVAAPALAADARWSRQDGAVLAMVNRQAAAAPAAGASRPTLVLIQSDQEYVMHPISGLANRWDGQGPLVYGLWSGTSQDLAALAGQSSRRPFVLTLFGTFAPHPLHLAATLQPIRAKSGATVSVHVSSAARAGTSPILDIDVASGVGGTAAHLACSPSIGGWDVTVSAGGTLTCAPPGGSPNQVTLPAASATGGNWDASLRLRTGGGSNLTIPVQGRGGIVSIVAVGPSVARVGSPPVGLLAAE